MIRTALAWIAVALPLAALAGKPAPVTGPSFATLATQRTKVADTGADRLYGDGRGLARAGTQLLVAFVDQSESAIWVSRSLDGGLTWRLAQRVAGANAPGQIGMRIALAVGPEPGRADQHRVHLAYRNPSQDPVTGAWTDVINYTYATLDPAAGLGGFTAPRAVSGPETSPSDYELTIAADALGGVHVAAGAIQGTYVIIYSRSTDHGDSFVEIGTVLPSGAPYPGYPALAAAPTGEVFLAWVAGAQNDLWVARRSPGAASFGTPVLAAPNFSNPDVSIAVADANHVYVAATYDSFYVARSADGGSTWQVTAGPAGSLGPIGASIAVSATGTIGVAWGDYQLKELRYARSTDGGVTFSPPAKIAGGNYAAAVVFDAAGKANVVFGEDYSLGGSHSTIWFVKEQ